MIHNLRIELNGDEARSVCVMMTAMWPRASQMVGEYQDRFSRTGGSWRFSARLYVVFGDASGAYTVEAKSPVSLRPRSEQGPE